MRGGRRDPWWWLGIARSRRPGRDGGVCTAKLSYVVGDDVVVGALESFGASAMMDVGGWKRRWSGLVSGWRST